MQRLHPGHEWDRLHINRQFQCLRHKDEGNRASSASSFILGVGDYTGGELVRLCCYCQQVKSRVACCLCEAKSIRAGLTEGVMYVIRMSAPCTGTTTTRRGMVAEIK